MTKTKGLLLIMMMAFLGIEAKTEVQFLKRTIQVGKKNLQVEIADNPEKAARGLMYRTSLKVDEGMLFIFHNEVTRHFWMKNTFIPLSIGFFDKNKKLVDVQEMQPVTSEMQKNIPTYTSKMPAQFVLEMPSGWFKKNKIRTGAKLKID